MKKWSLLFLLLVQTAFSQQSYYNDVNLSLTGENLYDALQIKISQYNQSFTYGDARDILVFTDEDMDNSNNVLLVYGYDNSAACTFHRSRDKNDFGGMNCEYNREHVFARSQSVPSMGNANNSSVGIIADPHNIRPSDQQMNNTRGEKKFQDGSGNAGTVGSGNWYPGDEWKGDVARMMMYMYTRYGEQCLPSYVGVGNLQDTTQMLQTFLQWNVDDPVSELEEQRNDYLETVYGNRNPFIDNPVLATLIWGGPQAEDRWGLMSTQDVTAFDFVMYPNPAENNRINIYTDATVDAVVFYDIKGSVVVEVKNPVFTNNTLEVSNIPQGFYFVSVYSSQGNTVKRLIVR